MALSSFYALDVAQNTLDNLLFSARIDVETYVREWDSLLEALGWTVTEYIEAIDRRWDTLTHVGALRAMN